MPRLKYTFFFLVLVTATVWLAVFSYPEKDLKIIACDVGQGDAILTIYGNLQILTDGGGNNKVLDCLARYSPFWDREIELVVLTHPEEDHFSGLVEVFRRYKVDNFLVNKVESSTSSYGVLKKAVGSSRSRVINPHEGMVIRFGLIQMDILHPSGIFSPGKSASPNVYSIVYELKFKDFEALFSGDIAPKNIEELLGKGLISRVDYIKIPHHGSRNGITPELLEATNPSLAVISVGKNNLYGHPHEEVLEMLMEKGIKILRTDEMGDVRIETDGKNIGIEN